MQTLTTSTGIEELQRLAELGRISASLLHEISNPVTAAMLNLEIVDENPQSVQQARKDLKAARDYIEAASQQIRIGTRSIDFSFNPQIARVRRVVIPFSRRSGVRLNFESAPSCKLNGDPVKLQQVLANLIVNAIEAYNEPVESQALLVEVAFGKTSKYLTIKICDWGKGVATADLHRIFEPFYTTKQQSLGRGMGIGLALVKQYVTEDFGGSIKVTISRRRGTQFVIRLPVVTES